MKKLLVFLLLTPAAFGKSPFDGTWVLEPPVPQKPIEYSLANGTFHCSGCIANVEVKADGQDHKVTEGDYWDTVNVQALDTRSVQIVAKKDGKTMFTELASVSPDGSTLTQQIKDTTEKEPVKIETLAHRIVKAPSDAHLISGSWHAFQVNRSSNASLITYKCTSKEFRANGIVPLTLGEFSGRFQDLPFDGRTWMAH